MAVSSLFRERERGEVGFLLIIVDEIIYAHIWSDLTRSLLLVCSTAKASPARQHRFGTVNHVTHWLITESPY